MTSEVDKKTSTPFYELTCTDCTFEATAHGSVHEALHMAKAHREEHEEPHREHFVDFMLRGHT